MSQYTVDFIWHPAFELVTSLQVYVDTRLHKAVDFGVSWRAGVRAKLPKGLAEHLQAKPRQMKLVVGAGLLLAWAWSDRFSEGKSGTIEDFLSWAEGLSVGELYEIVASLMRPGEGVPRDLEDIRDEAVRVLGLWHTHYFGGINPDVLAGLAGEAQARRTTATGIAPEKLVEEVSGHVFIQPDKAFSKVALIPQFHARPWNLFHVLDGILLHLYPVDVLPPAAGEPHAKLIRLTKALNDSSRLRILQYVAGGPRSFKDITRYTGLTKATIHHHLVLLRAAGLLRVETCITRARGDSYALRRSALSDLPRELEAFLSALPESGGTQRSCSES